MQEQTKAGDKGWYLVCVSGYPLGWGKLDRGMLKNKYCPGWDAVEEEEKCVWINIWQKRESGAALR